VIETRDPVALSEAFERAWLWLASLSPEEREAHFEMQRKAWVKAEMAIGDEGTRVAP